MFEIIVECFYASSRERDAHMEAVRQSGADTLCRAEEGNIRYEYFVSTKDDHSVILLEQWESQQAQEKHTHTSQFKTIIELKKQYVQSQKLYQYDCREL